MPGLDASEEGFSGGVFGLIERSSVLSKGVLILLLLFSIASWAIILLKLRQFRRVENHTASFREVFRRSSKFSDV